jgi:hypothetical protein
MNVQSVVVAGWIAVAVSVVGCSTGVPTDTPGVLEIGDETVVYDGPELSMSLNTREAKRHIGSEYIAIEVSLGERSTSKMLTIDRDNISIQAPDRRRFPLMTQGEFIDAYHHLAGAAMRIGFQPTGSPEISRMEAPCVDWYFRKPTDGLARDRLTIVPFRSCWGPLFFHVPGGVQPGRWELQIDLEESKAEIPFSLDYD